MSGSIRSDRSPLARPVQATIFEGRVARVHVPGDALIYNTGPEHRDEDEVKNIVSQLAGLKIYLGHPKIFPASESGQKVVGTVQAGRFDDDCAVARMIIEDKETLDAIEAGTHELSLGYRSNLDDKRYQRGIVLDHLAVVERARCGAACALRVDEQGEVTVKIEVTEELKKMLDGFMDELKSKLEPEITEVVEAPVLEKSDCACKNHTMPHNNGESMETVLKTEYDALMAKLEAANKKIDELEVIATNAQKDAEVATGKVASAEKALEDAKADAASAVAQAKKDAEEALTGEIAVRVDARVALLVEAGKVVKDDLSKLSDREIKCAVIKHVDGDDVPAEKSMDYVTGVYEGALKRAQGATVSRETVRTTINDMRKDGQPLSGKEAEAAARAKMKFDSATAWTK